MSSTESNAMKIMNDLCENMDKYFRDVYNDGKKGSYNYALEDNYVATQKALYGLDSTDKKVIADGINKTVGFLQGSHLMEILRDTDIPEKDIIEALQWWNTTWGGGWMLDIIEYGV